MNKHFTFQEYIENFSSIQDSYDYYFEQQKEIDRLNNIINGLKEEIEIYIDITIDHLETNNEEINFELRNKCRAMREIKDDILNIIKKFKEQK